MKIIVTGCKGQLGTEIIKQLREGRSEIGPIPEKLMNATVIPVDLPELDISNYKMVDDFIRRQRPDVIINCAAYTNVDGCETNREAAFAVNALGARNLAMAAEEQLGDAHALDNNIVAMAHPDGMTSLLSGSVECHLTTSPYVFKEAEEDGIYEVEGLESVWPDGNSFIVIQYSGDRCARHTHDLCNLFNRCHANLHYANEPCSYLLVIILHKYFTLSNKVLHIKKAYIPQRIMYAFTNRYPVLFRRNRRSNKFQISLHLNLTIAIRKNKMISLLHAGMV